MNIGVITTKSGRHCGMLTDADIDCNADVRTFFTMYSAIMHDVKRYGYKETYRLWTDDYERLIQEAGFIGKDYCLRAGEAVRYYCAEQADEPFIPKFNLKGNEGWIINWLYLDDSGNFDTDFLDELQTDIANVEDCFALYRIVFTIIDQAI